MRKHNKKIKCVEWKSICQGIENVRTFLGHVSLASTGCYLKVDDDAASAAICSALGA